MAVERLGTAPADREGALACANHGCSDVFRVDGAEGPEGIKGPTYAVVGTLATAEQVHRLGLPEDAGVAEGEALVFVPENVLLAAAKDMLALQTPAPAAV